MKDMLIEEIGKEERMKIYKEQKLEIEKEPIEKIFYKIEVSTGYKRHEEAGCVIIEQPKWLPDLGYGITNNKKSSVVSNEKEQAYVEVSNKVFNEAAHQNIVIKELISDMIENINSTKYEDIDMEKKSNDELYKLYGELKEIHEEERREEYEQLYTVKPQAKKKGRSNRKIIEV